MCLPYTKTLVNVLLREFGGERSVFLWSWNIFCVCRWTSHASFFVYICRCIMVRTSATLAAPVSCGRGCYGMRIEGAGINKMFLFSDRWGLMRSIDSWTRCVASVTLYGNKAKAQCSKVNDRSASNLSRPSLQVRWDVYYSIAYTWGNNVSIVPYVLLQYDNMDVEL